MKNTAKQIVVILLVSAVVAVVANRVNPRRIAWIHDWSHQVESRARKQQIKIAALSVTLEKFREQSAVFIDARTEERYLLGHIPGARSVPLESFTEQFLILADLIDSGRELVVYCSNRECDDALLLATELQSMGSSNLMLYIDGFETWVENGGPVEAEK